MCGVTWHDADPRISNLRPAWLADNDQWRDQLQAMDRDDARWIEHQWELAGGAQPAVDTSWITTEPIDPWGIWPLIIAAALLAIGITATLANLVR